MKDRLAEQISFEENFITELYDLLNKNFDSMWAKETKDRKKRQKSRTEKPETQQYYTILEYLESVGLACPAYIMTNISRYAKNLATGLGIRLEKKKVSGVGELYAFPEEIWRESCRETRLEKVSKKYLENLAKGG